MIPFRGRLSDRQFLPAQPCKFDRKVWEMADSTNGYVYGMQVYTGKSGIGQREDGFPSRVVTHLTRDLVGKNHHVYMDNFFSSASLFRSMLRDNIYSAGTVRTKGWPQSCILNACQRKTKVRVKLYTMAILWPLAGWITTK